MKHLDSNESPPKASLISPITTLGHESLLFDSGGTFCERVNRAAPPRVQPGAPLGKSLSHLCRKYRPLGRFCRLSRFISHLPSIFWLSNHSMAWKRSSVRSRSGPPINYISLQNDLRPSAKRDGLSPVGQLGGVGPMVCRHPLQVKDEHHASLLPNSRRRVI